MTLLATAAYCLGILVAGLALSIAAYEGWWWVKNKIEEKKMKKLTATEAAAKLGICVNTLTKLRKAGVLKSYKTPGGARYYLLRDLDEMRRRAARHTDNDLPRGAK